MPYIRDSAIADFSVADKVMGSGGLVCVDNGLEVIAWWAKKRSASIFQREGSDQRGCRIP